jgi:hypothetical protein
VPVSFCFFCVQQDRPKIRKERKRGKCEGKKRETKREREREREKERKKERKKEKKERKKENKEREEKFEKRTSPYPPFPINLRILKSLRLNFVFLGYSEERKADSRGLSGGDCVGEREGLSDTLSVELSGTL